MSRENTAGELLKNVREKKGIVQARLCQGLCNRGVLVRMEREGHFPQKQLWDAFLQRLGISAKNFEIIYTLQEFEQTRKRADILRSLQVGKYGYAEVRLKEYNQYSVSVAKNIFKQFDSVVTIFLKLQKNKDIEKKKEVEYLIREALNITIFNFHIENISEYLLHDEEIMLIMMLVENFYKQGKIKEAIRTGYALAEYVEKNILDEEEQLRLFPRIALSLSGKLLLLNKDEGKYYCEHAFRLLIKHQRIHYLPELMEIILCYKKMGHHFEEWIEDICNENILNQIKENIPVEKLNGWQLCLVTPTSTNGYVIGKQIRNLRTALGLTQENFGEICDPLTICRIERGRTANKNNCFNLLEYMGRNGEQCIPVLKTNQYEMQSVRFKFIQCIQKHDWSGALFNFSTLERKLDENESVNAQFLISGRALLEMHQGNISQKIYLELLCKALSLTAPVQRGELSVKNKGRNLPQTVLLKLLKHWPLTQLEAIIWNQIAESKGTMGENGEQYLILTYIYKNHIEKKDVNLQCVKWHLAIIHQLAEALWKNHMWKDAIYYCDKGIENSIFLGDGYYLYHLLHVKIRCLVKLDADNQYALVARSIILLTKLFRFNLEKRENFSDSLSSYLDQDSNLTVTVQPLAEHEVKKLL